MNDLLNIDFKGLLPSAIEAFTYVYGEEYHDIIDKRLNSSFIIGYQNYDMFKQYINRLYECKNRELAIKFLNMIGEDTSNYKSQNYTEDFDGKTRELLKIYLSSLYEAFPTFTNTTIYDNDIPIKCLRESYDEFSIFGILDKDVINLINHLRGTEIDEITEFVKTDEYQEIYNRVSEYVKIYESLLKEQNEWSKQFSHYYEILKKDQENKKSIKEKAASYLIKKILEELPSNIRNRLAGKSYEEIKKTILGSIIGYKVESFIESFSNDHMKRLRDKDASMLEKNAIIWSQQVYLRGLGIDLSKLPVMYNTDEDISIYLEFINQEDVKKCIPYDFIDKIEKMREAALDEAMRDYLEGREDFIRIKKDIANYDDKTYHFLLNCIKDNMVCVSANFASDKDHQCKPIMFYTLRDSEFGLLSHTFMHECGHAIDKTAGGCGFEPITDFTSDVQINQYNQDYRKYERFNETINDIFTMQANEYLWTKGIYLIEPQEYTKADRADNNTSHIIKQLLYPLLDKFHDQVVKAKLHVDKSELTSYIGEDNFEDLVDVINKVDYLVYKGLMREINNNNKNSELVKEYEQQVARLKIIYQDIDEYYNKRNGMKR